MPLMDNELARRDEKDGVMLRASPLRVRLTLDGLCTSDGHVLRCSFGCSVRALENPTDKKMLRETLLDSRRSVFADDLAEHFAAPLRTAAGRRAATATAEHWIGGDGADRSMIEALRPTAQAVAFGCGLELLAPFEATFQSDSYQKQQLEAMQQKLAEQRAAGQIEHFQRAAELLRKFQSLRDAAPDLSAGQVLQQIGEADRGSVLQTLLMASAQCESSSRLWAVAGPYLVLIDAAQMPPRHTLHALPASLGPLRSVRPAVVEDRQALLIGARSGFFVVRAEAPCEAQTFQHPAIESQLGFNSVIDWGAKGFWGTHGEAGLVGWQRGETARPGSVVRLPHGPIENAPEASDSGIAATLPQGPRNLTVLSDSHLLFSIGSQLFAFDGQSSQPLGAKENGEVLAIVPNTARVYAIYDDGTICTLDRSTRQVICCERRGVRLRAAGPLPWLGSTRLLLASEQGPIDCIGFDDQLVTQYTSPYRGLRLVSGSTDLVAAVSPDRQRLILWKSWDGRRPAAELHLGGIARHRIADLAFG